MIANPESQHCVYCHATNNPLPTDLSSYHTILYTLAMQAVISANLLDNYSSNNSKFCYYLFHFS